MSTEPLQFPRQPMPPLTAPWLQWAVALLPELPISGKAEPTSNWLDEMRAQALDSSDPYDMTGMRAMDALISRELAAQLDDDDDANLTPTQAPLWATNTNTGGRNV